MSVTSLKQKRLWSQRLCAKFHRKQRQFLHSVLNETTLLQNSFNTGILQKRYFLFLTMHRFETKQIWPFFIFARKKSMCLLEAWD